MSDERDPIAEQDDAARVFLEQTGRKSTDPSPPKVLHLRLDAPTAVFGRFPGGTDPLAAVREVFATMFENGAVAPSPYPDAIEADVVESDGE